MCTGLRFMHQFVINNAGFAADEADAWLAEFDALEQEHAFFFAMNRLMFVAVRTWRLRWIAPCSAPGSGLPAWLHREPGTTRRRDTDLTG